MSQAPHQRILSILSKDVWIAKSFLNQNICAGPSDISKKFPIINHTFASHLDSLRTGVYSAVQALRTVYSVQWPVVQLQLVGSRHTGNIREVL